mmetsp:Transcript_28844/g.52979  ORF Transcript_28844/g.52979 Transcript_28844/m.52979 type:complete len:166 (+) Transcript_28844:36-533(+)
MSNYLSAEYFITPAIIRFWEDKSKVYGPIISGALFGAGWWFWIDAVACSTVSVPFDRYIPGLIATLALIMINCIRRDDLADYDPFDEASYCRSRTWLFISYIVSFSSIIAAIWVMILHYVSNPALSSGDKWTGAAGVFQVTFILGSGLTFFASRTPSSDSSYGLI